MPSNAHLSIIKEKIKSLNIESIQKIIFWLYEDKKKPSFLGCFNKNNFKSLNIIFLSENIKALKHKFKNGITGTMQEKFTMEEIHNYIFKRIDRSTITPDINNITEYSIIPFIISDPISIYQEDSLFVESTATISLSNECMKNASETNIKEINNESIETKINGCIKSASEECDKSIKSANNKNMTGDKKEINYIKELDRFYSTSKHFLVSIDCEMVITTVGKELGRLSIVDNQLNILYDRYILPENKIIDYCTEYSGLDKDSFKNAISFSEMKRDIQSIIGYNTVILGHSLYNDLTILKIYHEKMIDTSRLFRTKDNYKISLKNLARKYLGRDIQGYGHCSVEDAGTCVFLLAIKIEEYWRYKNTKEEVRVGNIKYNLRVSVERLRQSLGERTINSVFLDNAADFNVKVKNEDSLFIFFYYFNDKICYYLWTKSLENE